MYISSGNSLDENERANKGIIIIIIMRIVNGRVRPTTTMALGMPHKSAFIILEVVMDAQRESYMVDV